MEQSAIKTDIPFVCAVCCLERNKLHTFVFVDFRRLAVKKALASSRKSFSFFSRRISLSCALSCARSCTSSSCKLRALCGVCVPHPRSRYPSRWARVHVYIVFLEIPQLFGGFCLTDFLPQLDCMYLKFVIVLPVCCHCDLSFSSLTLSKFLAKKLSTLFIQHQSANT